MLGIAHGEIFDENFLMAVATVGAMLLGIYNECNGREGEFAEGVAVMLFYQIGELFQSTMRTAAMMIRIKTFFCFLVIISLRQSRKISQSSSTRLQAFLTITRQYIEGTGGPVIDIRGNQLLEQKEP